MSVTYRAVGPLLVAAFFLDGRALAIRPVSGNSGVSRHSKDSDPLSAATKQRLKKVFGQLIDAENSHDISAVRPFVWESPSTLFVAKTATAAEGNWAGFWGTEVVIQHFRDLYKGSFRMDPDYSKQKIAGLTRDVAVIYTPFKISVSYAGQTPVPKPFLVIMNWVKTPKGWRMASDIAMPIPPAPKQ